MESPAGGEGWGALGAGTGKGSGRWELEALRQGSGLPHRDSWVGWGTDSWGAPRLPWGSPAGQGKLQAAQLWGQREEAGGLLVGRTLGEGRTGPQLGRE